MITPAYIARIFVRMGYASDEISCRRRLTDWRQKGLLPPLKVRGCQHHGKIYYWDNPEITAQAVIIYKLFKLRSRSEWVILSTWFAGYQVPIEQVRKKWSFSFEKEIDDLNKQVDEDGELANVLSRIDRSLLMQKKRSKIIPRSYYLYSLYTNTFLNPEFDFEDFDDAGEFEKLVSQLWPDQADSLANFTNLLEAKKLSKLINKNLSFHALYEVIRDSSDQLLEQVHNDWCKAKVIIIWLRKIFSDDMSKLSKEGIQSLILLGKIFIILNLVLTKKGYELKIRNSLNALCELLPSIDVDEMKLMFQNRNINTEIGNRIKEINKYIMYIWNSTPMNKTEELFLENHQC